MMHRKSIDFNDDEVKSIIKTFIKRIAKTGDSHKIIQKAYWRVNFNVERKQKRGKIL